MHEEIREELESYALGALEPDARALVEAHLATCEGCRSLAREYELVAATLPGALDAASPTVPVEGSRQHLLRRVRQRRLWPRLAGTAAVLAAILLVASLIWSAQLSSTLAQERALYQQLSGQQELVFEVIDSPNSRRFFLRAPTPGATSYGKVFTRPDLPFVVAMAGRLPPPPPGQGYHLWLTLQSGELLLAGVIVPNPEGFGSLVYEAPRSGPELEGARLTLQPFGASTPAGIPVLLWVR